MRALEVSRKQGFTICDTEQTVEEYMKTNKLTSYLGQPLTINRNDGHPSWLQHRMIAEGIARHIIGIEHAGREVQ